MNKFFSTLTGLFVAAILAFGVIVLMGWKRVPDLIADGLAKKLGVKVEIESITGDINDLFVDKIQIDNPDPSVLPQAFTCDKIEFHAAVSNYLNQDVVIEEIDLDTVYFDIEFDRPKGKKGNWKTIMDNASNTKEELKNEAQGKAEEGDAVRTVWIKNLVLTNITTDLVYRNKHEVNHLTPIDKIVLKDLKSEGGPVMSQIVKLVLGQSLKAVFEEQHIKQGLPGGRLRYLLPLRRLQSSQFLEIEIENGCNIQCQELRKQETAHNHKTQSPACFRSSPDADSDG